MDGTVENSVVGRDCVIKPGAVVKNCILLTNVTIGEGVHIEGQVVDKNAKITKVKEILADPEHPGYVHRSDSGVKLFLKGLCLCMETYGGGGFLIVSGAFL